MSSQDLHLFILFCLTNENKAYLNTLTVATQCNWTSIFCSALFFCEKHWHSPSCTYTLQSCALLFHVSCVSFHAQIGLAVIPAGFV